MGIQPYVCHTRGYAWLDSTQRMPTPRCETWGVSLRKAYDELEMVSVHPIADKQKQTPELSRVGKLRRGQATKKACTPYKSGDALAIRFVSLPPPHHRTSI